MPCNFRPLVLGFDLELHSATKYLNGHLDIVAGVVISSQELLVRLPPSSITTAVASTCMSIFTPGPEDAVAEDATARRERPAIRTVFARAATGRVGLLPEFRQLPAMRASAETVCRGG